MKFAEARASDAPPGFERVLRGLELDLRLVAKSFERDLKKGRDRARSGVVMHGATGRRAVVEACVRMNIDPPAPGARMDFRAVKNRMRHLAKELHPDVAGASSTEQSFREVMEAYRALEKYDEQFADE